MFEAIHIENESKDFDTQWASKIIEGFSSAIANTEDHDEIEMLIRQSFIEFARKISGPEYDIAVQSFNKKGPDSASLENLASICREFADLIATAVREKGLDSQKFQEEIDFLNNYAYGFSA